MLLPKGASNTFFDQGACMAAMALRTLNKYHHTSSFTGLRKQNKCSKSKNRDRKNHDSQRRDRILRFFLRPGIGQFSPHFGAVSSLSYTVNLEKGKKMHWRKLKKIQWRRRPEIADFAVPCCGRTCPERSTL